MNASAAVEPRRPVYEGTGAWGLPSARAALSAAGAPTAVPATPAPHASGGGLGTPGGTESR